MSKVVFWVVWNPIGRVPMYRHMTEASAIAEAERLARANHGQQFYVLKAQHMRVTENMVRVCLEDEPAF